MSTVSLMRSVVAAPVATYVLETVVLIVPSRVPPPSVVRNWPDDELTVTEPAPEVSDTTQTRETAADLPSGTFRLAGVVETLVTLAWT